MKTYILFLLLSLLGVAPTYTHDNCTTIDNCYECMDASCHWIQCLNMPVSCQQNGPAEGCNDVPCESTTTTTEAPTTTVTPETTTETPTDPTTTTEAPTDPTTTNETPTEPTTTTEAPTDPTTTESPPETTTMEPPITTSSEAPTTESPSPPVTTESPTTVPSTTQAPCPGHHFDAGSFFGGIFLAVGVLVVSYAGLRFYRARNGRNYNQL